MQAMKEAILQIPELATPQQVREFLGGYWVLLAMDLGFAEKARHYMREVEKIKNWTWTEPMKRISRTQTGSAEAPALALPGPVQALPIVCDEKRGMEKES